MAKNNRINFLNYIGKPISKESTNMIYGSNNIKFEKCELYSDFIQSLLLLVFDTYLGDDIMSPEAQIKHFKWCWDKNLENFEKEGIIFKNGKAYRYFFDFTLDSFYFNTEKNPKDYIDEGLLNIWLDIFDYSKQKTKIEIDTLVEVYVLLNDSLKK